MSEKLPVDHPPTKRNSLVIIARSDPNTIANSKAGAEILQNLSIQLIGQIEPTK